MLALERKAKDALGEEVARLTDELQVSLSARQQLEGQLRASRRGPRPRVQAAARAQDLVRLGNDLAALQALKAELEREAASLSRRSGRRKRG